MSGSLLPKDMEAQLVRLWNTDLSASQIGARLARDHPGYHGSLSRNAVIGHVHRRRAKGYHDVPERAPGLRGIPVVRDRKPPAARKPRKEHIQVQKFCGDCGARINPMVEPCTGPMCPHQRREYPEAAAAESRMPRPKVSKFGHILNGGAPKPLAPSVATVGSKPLMELTDAECHWPVGDDNPQLYCAQPSIGQYCVHHGSKGRR